MSNNFFFKFMLSFLLIIGVCLAVSGAWETGDVVKALFADKPSLHVPTTPTVNITATPDKPASLSTVPSALTVPSNSGVAGVASKNSLEELPMQVVRPKDSYHKVRWSPPPPGFLTADTFNYLIYREKNPVTENIKTLLDNIHGNLMLELTPFTLIVKPNKILVMLFNTRESYHDFTNLPVWSGAASDLQSDTMYMIESNNFLPLSVHELTHLYFDGYFLPTISPLWVSEGVAVYAQVAASKQKPNWIDASLRRILAGNVIPLEELTLTEDLSSYDTATAELWYTQAYSLVDYLINHRSRDEFYKLCTELKNKTPLHQALYRTYGMPFNKVSVLQNVWLHDLQKSYQEGRILQNLPPSALPKKSSVQEIKTTAKQAVKTEVPSSATSPAKKQQPVSTPVQKTAPTPTKINKLQMVPVPSYSGGF